MAIDLNALGDWERLALSSVLKPATVLLTGATGFVGRQILRQLIDRAVPVHVILRKNSADRLGKSLTGVTEIVTNDAFSESVEWWANACVGVDTVIHAAWYTNPEDYLRSLANLHCLQGSLRLAEGVLRAGVRRLIGVGTCFEYDLAAGTISTTTPLSPTTTYAGCKTALYVALQSLLPSNGVAFAWCRLFYLHGEGEHPARLVPYLHRQLSTGQEALLSSGTQVRDYLDVSVAATGIVDAAFSSVEGPVNVCSGVPVTVREFAESIADVYGCPQKLRFNMRPDNEFDPPRVVGVPTTLPDAPATRTKETIASE